MPITSTLVLVTAELKAENGETIRVRQCTEADEKLSNIYRMLGINPHPLEKIKYVVHPKPPSKKMPILSTNQLHEVYLQCGLKW